MNSIPALHTYLMQHRINYEVWFPEHDPLAFVIAIAPEAAEVEEWDVLKKYMDFEYLPEIGKCIAILQKAERPAQPEQESAG